ncbi:MAG TPA: sugar phosphate isomerase/epimerase [Armatimonadetes bacterium]|nr:sugar phosphate isomerase/epimerase [Armatimonadota bacterium]
MEKWPIGVFTSIGAGLGASLEAVKELGVPTVQLHAPPKELRTPEKAAEIKQQFAEAGITVTVVFCGFPGESYADIPTVRKTVGLVPPELRAERLQTTKEISDFAKALGVDAIAMHIGFIPEDPADPGYRPIVEVAQEVCDYSQANGQRFHLETGQETAEGLLRFIHDVGRDNLAVNFDPANMILYGSGNPIEALKKVGQYVKSVHCKDAKWAARPGEEWGEEVPLGEGDVGIETFLRTLKDLGYEGPLTIEREITGEQQKRDIAAAVKLLERLRAEIWGTCC